MEKKKIFILTETQKKNYTYKLGRQFWRKHVEHPLHKDEFDIFLADFLAGIKAEAEESKKNLK